MESWIAAFFGIGAILLLVLVVALALLIRAGKYDESGYDKDGYDRCGYDRSGYDRWGYDRAGYDRNGFNRYGYDCNGRNAKGQYNRLHDGAGLRADGFYNPRRYPVALTTHARERMEERLGLTDFRKMDAAAREAYQYGKSARQIKKSSAALVRDIEQRHDGKIVLIHRGYIYIFSQENVLITLYRNDKIPL